MGFSLEFLVFLTSSQPRARVQQRWQPPLRSCLRPWALDRNPVKSPKSRFLGMTHRYLLRTE